MTGNALRVRATERREKETMRSYTLDRRPHAIEIPGVSSDDAFDLGNAIALELPGTNVSVAVEGSCLILPAPYEVWREGRTLRGDEYEAYERACLSAASKRFPGRAIRFFVEEMYVFDWDVFRKPHLASLQSAYQSLPGWLASKELPRWFGYNETTGPSLSASVEPPGLQVAGVLELDQFNDWHGRFLAATSTLPVRSIA